MVEIDSIVLDDGREYYIVDNVEVDNVIYTFFSDVLDEKEIKIRKIITDNNKEFYVGLDNPDELKKVIVAYNKKINS